MAPEVRGLQALIDRLILVHGAEVIRRNLENNLSPQGRIRQRVNSGIYEDPVDAATQEYAVSEAMRMLFITMPPRKAIRYSCDLAVLVDLLQSDFQDMRFNRQSDIGDVAEAILQEFEIPEPRLQKVDSPEGAIAKIQCMRTSLVDEIAKGRADSLRAQGSTVSAWAYVQKMLQLSMGFYTLHFSQFIPKEKLSCFREAARRRSIGPILYAFREIEELFKHGETIRERDERIRITKHRLRRMIRMEKEAVRDLGKEEEKYSKVLREERHRESDFQRTQDEWPKTLDEEGKKIKIANISAKEERLQAVRVVREKTSKAVKAARGRLGKMQITKSQIREDADKKEKNVWHEKSRVAARLQAECEGFFGRRTPFQYVVRDDYLKWNDLYRNRAAHLTADELVESAKGFAAKQEDMAEFRTALARAQEIIEDLQFAQVVPRVVILVAEAQDAWSQRMVGFVDQSRIGDDGEIQADKIEWMYASTEFEYQPFQILAMIAPARDPLLNEPLFEPVMYPVQQVREIFEHVRTEGR